MTNEAQDPVEELAQEPVGNGGSGTPHWLIAVVVILALGVGYTVYGQYQASANVAAQREMARTMMARLEARAATLEDNYASLKGLSDETVKKLGLTRAQLSRARATARQIKAEQQKAAEQLAAQLDQLGSLSGEVTEVMSDVVEAKESLEATMVKLERTIGDLGVQSGLIASNRGELEELRQRGQRDYFEFDIAKSKRYTRVGDISIRLNKSDSKRQKFTMTLLLNDKRIEKKDKTLLEPVQFYMQGTRHLLEIVIFEVDRNRIVGYLSVPKEVAMAKASS